MKKLLLALALLLTPTVGWAQCSGQFPNQTVCGNTSGTTNFPRSVSLASVVAGSVSIKAPVDLATAANITLSGEQTIDGVLTSASRVLVKDQSTASENGIYVSAAGAWSRATDFNATGQVVQGTQVFVNGGSINNNVYFVVSTANPILIGTTSVAFYRPITRLIEADQTLTVPAQFATIADALASLANSRISSSATVTISVAAGTVVSASSLVISHPDGYRIQIIGATPVSLTIASQGAVSGGAGNWSVVLNTTASSAGVAIGDYVIIRSPTGTGFFNVHPGVWEVTAVGATSVTVKNTYYGASFPVNTLTGGDITALKTVLKFTGVSGITGGNSGLINNVAIVGDNTAGTFGVIPANVTVPANVSTITLNFGSNVGISAFNIGVLSQFASSVHAGSIAVSSYDTYGFSAQHGGTLFADSAIVSGGSITTYGVMSQYSSSIYFENGLATGNLRGVQAQLGSAVLFKNGTATLNETGASAAYNGTLQAGGATVTNNRVDGLYAYQGTIYFENGIATFNDVNGITADHGWVDATGATLSNNVANGVSATNSSFVKILTATLASNGNYGIFSNLSSYVVDTGASITGSGTAARSASTFGQISSIGVGVNNAVISTTSGGALQASATIPSATQDNITRTGTLVSGATGAGFTIDLNTSTISGTLPNANTAALTGDVTKTAGANSTVLATAQPSVHTWALAQTFTVAPVFTDQSGSRTALGLGTAATQTIGTSGTTVPLLSTANAWSNPQTITGTTPTNIIGPFSAPSASGSTRTDTAFSIVNASGGLTGGTLDFGQFGGSYGWIQSRNAGDYTTNYPLRINPNGGTVLVGQLQTGLGTLSLTTGAFGFSKMTASAAAPGAAGGKIELVCGTTAGTAKLIAYAGTSGTATTILDNIGAGVTGC